MIDVFNAAMRRVWTGGWKIAPPSPAHRAIAGIGGWAPGRYLVRARIRTAAGGERALAPIRLVVKR